MNKEFMNKICSTQKELNKNFLGNIMRVFSMLKAPYIKDIENVNIIEISINNKTYCVFDGKICKVVIGEDYNFIFDKTTGYFVRWGKTYKDDPEYSPIGGEILDIEVTTSCSGPSGNGDVCSFCYKSNTPSGKNMSLETFKNIMGKMSSSLTQVAFGADSLGTSNPYLFEMAKYCREKGIVPNLTIANVSDDVAKKLANIMGAVAVSRYEDKNICYDSVKKLTDLGMKQVNIHIVISEDQYDKCMETIMDIKTDPRLEKLNAIVFLALKQKGRGKNHKIISKEKYDKIVNFCMDNNMNFGMDSCSAVRFLDAVKDRDNYDKLMMTVEPCESTNFSQYIDVNGDFYPCSFCENIKGWEKGLNVENSNDYLKDIWYNDRVVNFRNILNENCNNCHKARECPVYDI